MFSGIEGGMICQQSGMGSHRMGEGRQVCCKRGYNRCEMKEMV